MNRYHGISSVTRRLFADRSSHQSVLQKLVYDAGVRNDISGLTINSTVTAVGPLTGVSISLTDFLTALIAGLPLVGFPSSQQRSTAALAFVIGFEQTPGLTKSSLSSRSKSKFSPRDDFPISSYNAH